MHELVVNHFLETLRLAVQKNWCVKPNCTTCGARDFRSALRAVGGDLGGPLVDALKNVNLDQLTVLPGWEEAIEVAVRDFPLLSQGTSLLESWLSRADGNIRFFDFVLYKLVRPLPLKNPVRERWIATGTALALQSGDFSLVESLILTLRSEAVKNRELMSLALEIAVGSKQMRRALRNACNLEPVQAQYHPNKRSEELPLE